jgi:hypothetical protein
VAERTLWPFPESRAWWRTVAFLLVLPITAVLHHLVFFRGMCMLNKIGPDYTPHVIALWLSRDPSLPIAILLSVAIWMIGRRWMWVRSVSALALVASVPLVLWIWDIPFTGRIICHSFHDRKLTLSDGTVVTSIWIYLTSLVLFAVLALVRLARSMRSATTR